VGGWRGGDVREKKLHSCLLARRKERIYKRTGPRPNTSYEDGLVRGREMGGIFPGGGNKKGVGENPS